MPAKAANTLAGVKAKSLQANKYSKKEGEIVNRSIFNHCKEAYSCWSDDCLLNALARYEELMPEAKAALKDVMSSKKIWPEITDESNPNWPSKNKGMPSGKGRGNNTPSGA